ncbi:MAG: putative membrane protein [Candidatus Azotimanducaceae bacterium]|jgi:uncharacterized membrane protein
MSGVINEVSETVQDSSASAKDSHLRSILKAFSWRIIATLTTALIAYFVTGEIMTAITIGGIEFFLKMGIYYVHERVWLLL